MERWDVAVVGGGPAGLATAIAASRHGLRCLVIERQSWPVDKACGEGVLPPGVAALGRLGVDPPAGVALEGVRYVEGVLAAEGAFPAGPGLGVRRLALSEALRARAGSCGVALREGTEALGWEQEAGGVRLATGRGAVRCTWLVGADGLHSRVRDAAGIAARRGLARFGVRRHYRCRPWTRHVEVHWTDGLEAYVTPVAEDCVGIAFLGADCGGGPDALLSRFPALASRLGPPASRARGAGPFRVDAERRTRGRVALVGDAAGYVDPLTGEGVALGLLQAEALAGALAADRLEGYERAWRQLTRRHRVLTGLAVDLARWPRLRRRALGGLARRPARFSALLAYSVGAPGAPGVVGVGGLLAAAVLTGPPARVRPAAAAPVE